MRTARLVLACVSIVLAACEPQTRRVLVLDEALTRGAALEATARPWLDAGYHVDYRRFYPHLTFRDLDTYRTVMILGGRRPSAASDALDLGDLALLTEWTLRGGVVILGYPAEGEGVLDRWLMNRWLAWSGAGIRIGNRVLHNGNTPAPPRARPILTAGLRGTGFDPFPVGASDPLRVQDRAQALARAVAGSELRPAAGERVGQDDVPLVAASRVARGLVVVLSRSALGSLGRTDSVLSGGVPGTGLAGTRAFLVALARWTRRPAEWARIPPAGPREPLQFGGATLTAAPHAPRAAPPAKVAVEALGRRPASPTDSLPAASGVPGWIERQGVRALQAQFPSLAPPALGSARLTALDTLSTLLDIGAFNVLLANARVGPLADSVDVPQWQRDALRAAWDQVAQHFEATSVRWIPLVVAGELERPDSAGGPSEPLCPLDPGLWERMASGLRVLARLARGYPEVIPAIGVALDPTTRGWAGPTVCGAAWQAGLAALARDSLLDPGRRANLAALAPGARYDSLVEAGMLAAYDSGLAEVVRQRSARLRAEIHRINRRVLPTVLLDRSPGDWYTTSLVHGLSTEGTPVLVFSTDPQAREQLAMDGAVNVLHAIRLDPTILAVTPVERLAAAAFQDQDGFWVGPAEAVFAQSGDRLARTIRQLSKGR